MKRILALLLAFIMMVSGASTVWADEVDSGGRFLFTNVNPLCESEIAASMDLLEERNPAISMYATGDYTSDINVVAQTVRKAMVARNASCSVRYRASKELDEYWFEDLIERVMAETGNPKEGDYLSVHYKEILMGGSYTYSKGVYYNDIEFAFAYNTNAVQEAEVDAKIPEVIEQLGFRKWMTDYEKIQLIYDFVRGHVKYDHQNSDSFDLKYSAYAALINRTAVCSGYAALFYRLAKAAGYDVRIVVGTSKGEGHAWNLIKLGNQYYYLDPTWDSGVPYTSFFMKGYADFPDHTAESPFVSKYNISRYAYDTSKENTAQRGACGPYTRWAVVNDSILFIYGLGLVNDMSGFYQYKDKIKDIYIFDSITGVVGNNISFRDFTALENITAESRNLYWELDAKDDVPEGVVFTGYWGTQMHYYANDYGFTFNMYMGRPFVDVEEADYYFEPVTWAVENNITTGVNSNHFAPEDSCNRGQAVTFIWRAYGQPVAYSTSTPFKDVSAKDYFYNPVLWAVDHSITTGVDKTHFKPEATLTRAQFVTFLWRAAGQPVPHNMNNPFKDVNSSDYYYTAVLWAVENNITTGVSKTKFGPDSVCTRGQVVTFLNRAFE